MVFFVVLRRLPYSSSNFLSPATSDTGSEKHIAPAFVSGPAFLFIARMISDFLPAADTMYIISFSSARDTPKNFSVLVFPCFESVAVVVGGRDGYFITFLIISREWSRTTTVLW